MDQNISKIMLSSSQTKQMMESESQDLLKATTALKTTQTTMQNSISSAESNIKSVYTKMNESDSSGEQFSSTQSKIKQTVFNEVKTALSSYNKQHGISMTHTELDNKAASVSAGLGFSIAGLGAKGSVESKHSESDAVQNSTSLSKSDSFSNSQQYATAISNIGSEIKSMTTSHSGSIDKGEMDNLQRSLTELDSTTKSYSEAVSLQERAVESNRKAETISASVERHESQIIVNNLLEKYGNINTVDNLLRRAGAGDDEALSEIYQALPEFEGEGPSQNFGQQPSLNNLNPALAGLPSKTSKS